MVVAKLEEEGYTVENLDTNEDDDIDSDAEVKGDDGEGLHFDHRILDEEELEEYTFHSKGGDKSMQGHRAYSGMSDTVKKKDYGTHSAKKGHREFQTIQKAVVAKDENVDADGLDDDKQLLLSGEDDLSTEDVLLPANPADDMKREIASSNPDKRDDEDDNQFINRMVSLAGIRRSTGSNKPQP
jgi:hypothetical protein